MRSSFFWLLGSIVNLGAAQSACSSVASAVPSCGQECIISAASGVGCASTDFACQCTSASEAAIQSAAQSCVLASCGLATALEVLSSASAVCACASTATADSPALITAAPAANAVRRGLRTPKAKRQAACSAVASAIPACGQQCLLDAGSACGCTATDDFSCQCSQSACVSSSAFNCVVNGCGIETGLQVQSSANALCSCVTSAGGAKMHKRQDACSAVASAIPSCGQQCLLDAGSSCGCTATDDFSCQCSQSACVSSSAFNCVVDGCGIATGLQVQSSANALCSCVTSAGGAKKEKRQDACSASASAIPACGQQCLLDAGSSCGCTATDDFACQCSQSACVSSSAFNCIVNGCGIVTGLQVQSSANALCSCVSTATAAASAAEATDAGIASREKKDAVAGQGNMKRGPKPTGLVEKVPTVFVTVRVPDEEIKR